jgi:hypothetical protein
MLRRYQIFAYFDCPDDCTGATNYPMSGSEVDTAAASIKIRAAEAVVVHCAIG